MSRSHDEQQAKQGWHCSQREKVQGTASWVTRVAALWDRVAIIWIHAVACPLGHSCAMMSYHPLQEIIFFYFFFARSGVGLGWGWLSG